MKKNRYLFGFCLVMLCLSSCYDDSSTLGTQDIGNVTLEDDASSGLHIGFQEELDLSPSLKISSTTDMSALTYEWRLTETSATSDNEFEVIGTDKDLSYIMQRPISSAPYVLSLTITDTAHDNLQYLYSWNVYVQSSFLDGILVCDTQDGNTSDFTLINSSTFTVNYAKDERIFRHILVTANGVPYDGLLQSLYYGIYGSLGSTHTNQIWAVTGEGSCVRFNCLDYSQNGQYNDETLFINKSADTRVYSFFKSYQDFYANTSDGIYVIAPSISNRFGSVTNVLKKYRANNDVIAYSSKTSSSSNNILISSSNNHLNFYDKEQGAFVTCSGYSQFFFAGSYEANLNFDPNNLPGQTAVTSIVYEDMTQTVFLLKDDATGEYTIYTLTPHISEEGTSPEQPASAKNKFAIPNEGKTLLDNAVSIFFSNKNLVLYVATSDGIYVINYGAGTTATVSTVAKFTPESGEAITKAKMFQQGIYKYDLSLIKESNATVPELEWSNNSIMIVTQKGEYEGKLYVIPISQSAVGTLDVSKAKIYDGFGKIQDVIGTGY